MPRAKKSPSEPKPRETKPEVPGTSASATQGAAQPSATKTAPVRATSATKTTEQSGKPVSSVNPQGASAGVKANGKGDTNMEAAIRARAYEIWERRGRPEGAGHDDWLQAEREIRSEQGKRTA
ncbi:MAG: DUF2934 domain-containing protein [Terriglobales bacterium]